MEKASNKPFQVRNTFSGGLLDGFDHAKQAEARAKQANRDAEELGIQARYEVVSDVEEPS